MSLFSLPNRMSPLQAAQVNAYQRKAQREDLLVINKNIQHEEAQFNDRLKNATFNTLPAGHMFQSEDEFNVFKDAHDGRSVSFGQYMKFYGKDQAIQRVLNDTNAASAILGYGKTIDLNNTKWNPETNGFDLVVRTEDREKGQAYSSPATIDGNDTNEELRAAGGQEAVDANRLPSVGLADVDFFLEQIKSRGQNAAGGLSALELLGGQNQAESELAFFQGNTRTLAETMAPGPQGAATATGPETTQMSGGITVDNIGNLGITTNIDISDRNIINKIIEVESGGDPAADSGHAKGLMQLKDSTADNPGLGVKPVVRGPNGEISAEENVRFGTDYFDALTEKYNGDLVLAAMAYNAGPGAIDEWIEGGRKYEELPKETQDYVAKIFGEDVREQVKTGTYGQGGRTYEELRTATGGPSSQASDEIISRNVTMPALFDPVVETIASQSALSYIPGVDKITRKVLDKVVDRYASLGPKGIEKIFENRQETDYERNYYSKGLEAPFGIPLEVFNSDKYSDFERSRLRKNEDWLITRNVMRLYREEITNGINKDMGNIAENLRDIWALGPSREKISVEDRNRLKEARRLYDKPGYGDGGSFSGGPLSPRHLKKIFNANPALVQQFKEDPIAFALAYKANPEAFIGMKIPATEINEVIKDSPFSFKQKDSEKILTAVKNGNVQEYADVLTELSDKYVGNDEVPQAFQQKVVSMLTEANNFIANSKQRRLDQHIMVGMWATLNDELRKTYAPYLMRFAETGRFQFEDITVANQSLQAQINERDMALQEDAAYGNISADVGKRILDLAEVVNAPGYEYDAGHVSLANTYINVAQTRADLIAARDTLGVSMKHWVAMQDKGILNSIIGFFTGGTDTPTAAFSLQPNVVAYDKNNELVTRPNQRVYRLVRVQSGDPRQHLAQKPIKGGTVISDLGPEGMEYLKGLAIANAKLIQLDPGG